MTRFFNKLVAKVQAFVKSEKGQGMVEYALIIAFIAAIAIVALNTGLRDAVVGAFDKASNAVTDATTGISTTTGTE